MAANDHTPDDDSRASAVGERHAGWLELFYDLLFVALVAQLAHPLVEHPGWEAALRMLALFLPAWWVWIESTLYSNLTGEGGIERRIAWLAQMAALLVMAAAATPAAHGDPAMYAGAYAATRVVLLILRFVLRGKGPAGGSNWPLLISAALWAGSTMLQPPLTYLLWLAGLLVEITPWLGRSHGTSQVQRWLTDGRIEISHLVERFGLFVIIVLGEGIALIIASIAQANTAPAAVITGLAAFLALALLWWLYFDFGSAVAEKTMTSRPEEAFRLTRAIFIIGHFLPVAALTAFAAGLSGLVTAAAQGHNASASLRLCAAALATYLTNNAILGLTQIRYPITRVVAWLLPNLILLGALALLADHLPPAVALLLITAFLMLEMVLSAQRVRRLTTSAPDAAVPSEKQPNGPSTSTR
ncbi:low temperature requirement protein A [Streptomyces sp. SBT349]|uniref:low temperature requirement protein A n=1 Tax=Streptomyces sp. SBT349 TaxID=1580539 RepID=UPI00066D7FFC|nr:low temperature requirement protein A [Streptomyces sp. SBT349]